MLEKPGLSVVSFHAVIREDGNAKLSPTELFHLEKIWSFFHFKSLTSFLPYWYPLYSPVYCALLYCCWLRPMWMNLWLTPGQKRFMDFICLHSSNMKITSWKFSKHPEWMQKFSSSFRSTYDYCIFGEHKWVLLLLLFYFYIFLVPLIFDW